MLCVAINTRVLLQGNGLQIRASSRRDTGVYICHLDNFVQPVVSYKFSLFVEGNTLLHCLSLFVTHLHCSYTRLLTYEMSAVTML